jgi:excisionase family DNA binding protein
VSARKTYTINEAAKKIGVTPETVRRWIAKGMVSPITTGGGARGRYSFTYKMVMNMKKNKKDGNNNWAF